MSISTTDKSVELDGIRLHYSETGTGRTIVFLHGAGGASPRGASFVPMLGEQHRLLVPSRPGFDETPFDRCETLHDVVEVMARFIERVGNGKVHLVAQSAGAAVGCWLAIRYPELVENLVLSAPSAFAVRHPPPAGVTVPPEDIERRLYGDRPGWAAPPTDAERQRIARNARENMSRFAGTEGNVDLRTRLGEITVPTLLICATDDSVVPDEALKPYQQTIRSCTRIFIYGAAHEMPISAASEWVRLVADFVDRGEYFVVNIS